MHKAGLRFETPAMDLYIARITPWGNMYDLQAST